MSDKTLTEPDISKKLDDLGHAITAAQKASDDKNIETCENAKKQVLDLMETVQKSNAKLESLQKSQDLLAKQALRGVVAMSPNDLTPEERKYKDDMQHYLRTGEAIDKTNFEMLGAMIVRKSLSHVSESNLKSIVNKEVLEGSSPQGGYFLRPQLASTFVTRIFETSPMRQVSTVVTVGPSSSFEFIIDDNQATSGGFIGEVSTKSETDTARIGRLKILPHEQFAIPTISNWMLEDAAFDIESWLTNKAIDVMSRTENTAFITGNGSQRPRGILTYPDYTVDQKADPFGAYGREAVEQVSSGSAGNITASSLKELQNTVKEPYQNGSKWYMRRRTFGQVIDLKDNQGRFIFNTRFLQERRTLDLLGQDVMFFNDMPDPAVDSLSVVYGNMKMGYTIVDRIGMKLLRDDFTGANQGLVKFRFRKRVGGAVTNFESFKILKLSA